MGFDWTSWLLGEKLEDHIEKPIVINGISHLQEVHPDYNIEINYSVIITVNEKDKEE